MAKKEKKYIAPNEASLVRWVAVLAVSEILGILLSAFLLPFEPDPESFIMGISCDELFEEMYGIPLFLGLVIAIKLVGKTSLKDFVLGVGGKINKKECLTVLGLYAAGFVLAYLPDLRYISLRGVDPGSFAFLVLFALLTVWLQTTREELVYRGLLIRWTCKNKVGFTKKAIIFSVITAVAFALGHVDNPEVTSQSGVQAAMTVARYGFNGLMLFIVDLYFGSLMPGILVHWANNFILSLPISPEVPVLPSSTLPVDNMLHSAASMLPSEFLLWLPFLVFMILDTRKKKKAASVD